MDNEFDLAIAGAGIMGLSSALEAARAGMSVLVFDPGLASNNASWAAAGILVTRDAQVFLSPFREFYVRSIHLYPDWLSDISQLSGETVALHRHGDYQVYNLDTPVGQEQYRTKVKQLEREHARDYSISDTLPTFLKSHCPLKNVKTLHFPSEAYVQNRDLLSALEKACRKSGVTFLAGTPTDAWQYQAEKTSLQFPEGQVKTKKILLTSGAWTGEFLKSIGISAPMIPVKGQMFRLKKFYAENCMVHFNEDIYLVPRGDSLIVGATTEPKTWSPGFDAIGQEYFTRHLNELLPEVNREPIETWAGFRPRTRDRLPWMGWIDSDRGWAICAGHYKCGISMAPLAAKCMVSLLNGDRTPVPLDPFQPWRRQGLSRIPPV